MGENAKYLQIIAWIRSEIGEHRLQPGQKLLSENELSERFGASRQTVRHAIGILEEEGVLTRRRGSGTYINERLYAASDRNRIAVVTTYVDSYIFPGTIRGIENYLSEQGYIVQLSFTNNQPARERAVLKDILARDDAAGVILEPAKSGLPSANEDLLQELMERRIPILLINSGCTGVDLPHVSLNDRAAGALAAEYLLENGHTRIGTLMKFDDRQGHLRYAGFQEVMRKAGLAAEDTAVWVDTEGEAHFEEYRDRVLRCFKDCTAVFCYNDRFALPLERMLIEAGIRIPEDLSIVSVDDSDLAELADVKLTSIHHPSGALGRRTAENLLLLMRDRSFDATCEYDPVMVTRDSVRRRA